MVSAVGPQSGLSLYLRYIVAFGHAALLRTRSNQFRNDPELVTANAAGESEPQLLQH